MKKLNNTQDAIQQAIEGGWRSSLHKANQNAEVEAIIDNAIRQERWYLDPLFWQALGKARGWIDEKYPLGSMPCDREQCDSRYCEYAGFRDPEEIAKRWFETRLSNGDENKFFQSLP